MAGRDDSPPGDRVDVSVLVLVRNEEAHIVRAIEGMLAQRLPGSYELLLIDGASGDARGR